MYHYLAFRAPVCANVNLHEVNLGIKDNHRWHNCLSVHFYSMFLNDDDSNINPHALDHQHIEEDCLCDEANDTEEDSEEDRTGYFSDVEH